MYTPLHVYSGYSFQKSGLQLSQYVLTAKKLNLKNATLTDFCSFSGCPAFAHLCIENGIKPIFGEDFVISNILITIIVKNEIGYKNLLNISLKHQKNTIEYSYLKEHNDGLIVIISSENIAFKKALLEDSKLFAQKLAKFTQGIKNLYIGIDNSDLMFANEMRKFCETHSYQKVAFPFVKYLKKDDAITLKMVEAISTKDVLQYKSLEGNEYLLSNEEIEKNYTKEEIDNTNKIADSIDFDLLIKRGEMIKFNTENLSSKEYLKQLCIDGLKQLNHTNQKYLDRLNYELETIDSMGYNDYFLIVHDYVNYAKNNGISVGPGRGSASGSLVSYCLGITIPDPIKYNLLFERFLNKNRQTMPDIDVDFSDLDRDKIVKYVSQKYGQRHVAKITAIQKIGAKQSLRDVGRIFNYPDKDIELFTKIISNEKDDKLTLREIYKTSKEFRDLVNDDHYYLEIVTLASKIEGLPRQTSIHAVGIVLNATPLDESIPITLDSDGSYIEQFEKDYIEEQGFLKMDILAIRNLSIIDECLLRLKQKGVLIKHDEIPYDDEDSLKIIRNGNTLGIFQLETPNFRNALKILKPKHFEDVVALLALNRPGPQSFIPIYAKRMEGKEKTTYYHPDLIDILKPTYGVIIYQEQIMQIASKFAGFSLIDADLLRRAISKKNPEKIAKMQDEFIKGSLSLGHTKKEAINIFEIIKKFGDYGFNRSHSLVYSIFSCRMAYLKAKYPLEFYASILSNANQDEFNNTLSEMHNLEIKVLPPNINKSETYFIQDDRCIIFPISFVKGISITTANKIIEERKNGEFKDLFDFTFRMNKDKITSQQILNLIDAGAFDAITKSRASLRYNLASAVSYADVFGDNGSAILDPNLFAKPIFEKVDDNYLDNLNKEKDVLGVMISGSPLDMYKIDFELIKATKIKDINPLQKNIILLVISKTVKNIKTKTGSVMTFTTIYDETGEIEVAIFQDNLLNCAKIYKDKIYKIEGYYSRKRNSFSVNTITPYEKELTNE